MNQLLTFVSDRSEHPLDVVERLAALRDWIFDRAEGFDLTAHPS